MIYPSPGMARGASTKNLPVIENFGNPALSGEAGPHHRRVKRASKFLGFFRDFSGKNLGLFPQNLGDFAVFLGNFCLI